jgi:DNA replication protein DnaC
MSDGTEQRVCPTHGAYEARRWTIPFDLSLDLPEFTLCPACVELSHQRERDRAAQALRSSRLSSLIEQAGIPPRFSDADIAGYTTTVAGQRQIQAICKAYVETWPLQSQRGRSLIFTGPCGTGKTHLACGIANAIMPTHFSSVRFGTAAALLRTVKDTYRKDSGGSESQALRSLTDTNLLIIDEVGAQKGTDHELQLLFEIIDARYSHKRPMILISNYTAEDLAGFLGERAMDRFRECATIHAFKWASYRATRSKA